MSKGSVTSSKVDEFRAIVRSISLEQCATISGVLHATLDSRSQVDPINKKKVVDSKAFTDGLLSVRQIRQKFTPADLADIYNDANENELAGVDIDELADFVQKTMGKARVLALKLRNALKKDHHTADSYRKAFLNICNPSTKVCDKDRFTQFAEDYLRITVNDNDAMGMYSLFDMNCDGKVSLDDFCGFMSGRSTEATALLQSGNPEVIVDIKISDSSVLDSEYMRAGYTQVIPTEFGGQGTKYDVSAQGSFGKGESIWIWRRKQGTCSGRLKPIVDIQLGANQATSSMVVAGYTSVCGSIAGLKLWIRRATSAADEKEALVALQVSLGNMKNPSDNIWTKPGVDWLRVDANFSKAGVIGTLMGSADAFLWMLPQSVRSAEAPGLQGLLRTAGGLSQEKRQEKICQMSRTAIRANVPVDQMRAVCNPISASSFADDAEHDSVPAGGLSGDAAAVAKGGARNADSETNLALSRGRAAASSMRAFDFTNLYHDYDQSVKGRMPSAKLYKILKHSGVWLEPAEVNYMFRIMDITMGGHISREEYAKCVSLTEHEIDSIIEKMRSCLLPARRSGGDDARDARILSQVFKLININGDGIISLAEFMFLMAALEMYVTEEEARKILKKMDIDGDDRVEETDFVTFLKHESEMHANRAHHLRETAIVLRRWLNRGGAGSNTDGSQVTVQANQKQWDELKDRYIKSRGGTFPNFLDAEDILLTCSYLDNRTSHLGSRELVLMIAPDQNGRITQLDLANFMTRTARSYGELFAMLERDIMKPLFEVYRAFQKAASNEDPNAGVLEANYIRLRKEVVQEVQNTTLARSAPRAGDANAAGEGYVQDIVSIGQLKMGIEAAMRRYKEFEGRALNAEEWSNMACVTGCAVAEEEVYGVHVQKFMENVLRVVAGSAGTASEASAQRQRAPTTSMDTLVREIQRLIHAEAVEAGGGTKLDYRAAFNIINKDGGDVLSVDEFRSNLVRLQLSHLCPDGELPKLLRLFDTTGKGHITFEDFMAFVNKYKGLVGDGSVAMDDLGPDQDDPARMGDTPPLAITRNADCDFVVWFIWRQCCRIEPSDPECIVTELEAACHETELTQTEGTISIKELWNLLFELKIQANNNIGKDIFEKGIRYLLVDTRGKRADNASSDQVDYSSLCRYVIRMGRGHSAMRDERSANTVVQYRRLRDELRQYLLALNASEFSTGYTPRYVTASAGGGAGSSSQSPEDKSKRIEKVFRRMDTDGDGKLTPSEFKNSLKRLGYKDERLWTREVIALFFKEFDSNSDGSISLEELSRLYLPESELARLGRASNAGGNARASKASDFGPPPAYPGGSSSSSSVEDPDDIFSGQKGAFLEAELLFKTFSVLKEMVPQGDSSSPVDAVTTAIRRFFSKNDPQGKGQVSEERFRAFMRRSGLLDRLTSGELRRLSESLRRRNLQTGGASTIDYEKLIAGLTSANANGPSSRSDMVLLRLRDAANNSAANGRPFYGLCALADPALSGRLLKEEVLLTAKMMGCVLTVQDLETLKDFTPDGCFGKDGTVDYKELNYAILNEQGGAGGVGGSTDLFALGPASFSRQGQADNRYTGATVAYNSATPFGVTPYPPARNVGGQTDAGRGATFATPRASVDRLADHTAHMHSTLPDRRLGAGATPGVAGRQAAAPIGGGERERDLTVVASRIKGGLDGARSTLPRLLERDDFDGTGEVDIRVFERAAEDIGVYLTSADLAIVQGNFPAGGVDRIDYAALWKFIQQSDRTSTSTAFGRTVGREGTGGSAAAAAAAAARGGDPVYVNARTLSRLAQCRAGGRDPRDLFEAYDLDHTGIVDAWRFREVLQRLGVLEHDSHVDMAAADFAALGSRGAVSYDDFCRVLESAEADAGRRNGGGLASSSSRDFQNSTLGRDRGGYGGRAGTAARHDADDALHPDNVDSWLAVGASPKQRREFTTVYDSLRNFKATQGAGAGAGCDSKDRTGGFPIALDEGSELDRGYEQRSSQDRDRDRDSGAFSYRTDSYLRPPKVSSSGDFGRSLRGITPSASRYGGNSLSSDGADLRRSASSSYAYARGADSPKAPSTSPGRVGLQMWGSHTSLEKKGTPSLPRVDVGLWCCAVCLYTENAINADKCCICDSPNYTKRPDFVLKEQCNNCTFLNGQFSSDCEMCGMPLRAAASASSLSRPGHTEHKERSSTPNRRY